MRLEIVCSISLFSLVALGNIPERKFSLKEQAYTPQNYEQSAGFNQHQNKCPKIPALSKALDTYAKGGTSFLPPLDKCSNGDAIPENNQKILTQAAMTHPGGHYDYKHAGATPINFNINLCGKNVANGGGSSYCSGGPYSTLIDAFEENICRGPQSDLKIRFGTGSKLYSVLNNDGTGMGDLAKATGIGENIANDPGQLGQKPLCPGDYVNFSRPIDDSGKAYGHAAMLLGVFDGKMYWWSAQSASDGWGLDCVDVSKISKGDFAVTRITHPEELATFSENKLTPYLDKPKESAKEGSEQKKQEHI